MDEINKFIDEINKFGEAVENSQADGLQLFSSLLALPDEQFEIIRPLIQENLEQIYSDPTAKMNLIVALEQSNLSVNDLINNIDIIIDTICNNEELELNDSKKDFIRQLFITAANALSDTSANPNRNIKIPVEICREDVKLPTYATNGSGAMDIYSPMEVTLNPGETKIIPIGIKVNIPQGYGLLIQPRSGLSARSKLRIPNSPGLIDSDYHEEIGVIIENITPQVKDVDIDSMYDSTSLIKEYGSQIVIGKGERFAQMRLIETPQVQWEVVNSLGTFNDENDHGMGFGSTGTK